MELARRFDVALCGYYGFGNLGDELLAQATVSLLEDNGVPRERIVILSGDVAGTCRSFGTFAVDRWNPFRVLAALRESRTLLLGGGGLFQDSTSVRSSLYYWGIVRMARMVKCRPWCFGQSVGPLKGKLVRYLARDALSACERRGVRDRLSLEILDAWGLSSVLSPDLVFGLQVFSPGRPAESDILLLNIRPWGESLPERLADKTMEYARQNGLKIRGIAMAEEDAKTMEQLEKRGLLELAGIERLHSFEDCSRAWPGTCAGAVGMRLHFCILTVLAGLPLLAVPYDPKVSGLAETLGIPTWKPGGPIAFGNSDTLRQIEEMKEKVGISFRETYLGIGGR